MALTRAEMIAIIESGSTVTYRNRTLSRVSQVPSQAQLDADAAAATAAAQNGIPIYAGVGEPSDLMGVQGSFYVDLSLGEVYHKEGVPSAWESFGSWVGGGAASLSELTDVFLTVPQKGEILVYDEDTGKWVNTSPTYAKTPVRRATVEGLPPHTFLNNVITDSSMGSALPPQDGGVLLVGERLLVKNEPLGEENGIYVVTVAGDAGLIPWVLTRAPDSDDEADIKSGMSVAVEEGDVNDNTVWFLQTNPPISLNTTPLIFSQSVYVAPHAHTLDSLSDVSVPAPSVGQLVAWNGSAWVPSSQYETLTFIIDGGGSVITAGIKGDIRIGYAATIISVMLLADQAGSIVIDLWKDVYSNFPPVDADSITGASPPTISSGVKSENTTLTGWSATISGDSIIRVNVDSATTITRCALAIRLVRL